MFLEKNRERILEEFEGFCREFPEIADIIKEKSIACTEHERLAMKYLYVHMPLSDVGNYDFSVFLDYVRQGVFLWETVERVQKMPEEIFLNYVLYHRVNEEEIKPCRTLFGKELLDRIRGMSMEKAALEVNYWCAGEATYQSTDERTSSALEVYRCGYGRCGEESVFCVNALRSAGLPARQVYAPRWAHCDDNHAWVEVWCDGDWHYLGACEPEPVLNKGWFCNAASRAMMVSSRWFDTKEPGEETAGTEGINRMLNQLGRYAKTVRITVKTEYADGRPAKGAAVHAEVMNYGEFFPVARLTADEKGEAKLQTGRGSLHIFAFCDGLWGECMLDAGQETNAVCVLGEEKVSEIWTDFDMTAPLDTAKEPPAGSPREEEENAKRLREAKERRRQKTESFRPLWQEHFLAGDSKKAWEWMSVLSEKDRRDADPEVLKEHYEESLPYASVWPKDIFLSYVWNPRVWDEVLTKWRKAIRGFFREEEAEAFRRSPRAIWSWIETNISSRGSRERDSIFTCPAAALFLKTAGEASKKVLFVAIARTFGIPARKNPRDDSLEYYENGQFVPVLEKERKTAQLTLLSGGKTWTYFQNWSIARLDDKGYESLKLEELCWEDGRLCIALEPGTYRILSGNRLPNGNIFGRRFDFCIEDGQSKQVELSLREAQLSDMLDEHTIPDSVFTDAEGNTLRLSDYTRSKSRILFWLDVGKEPTEHILNELVEQRTDFARCQDRLLFVLRGQADLEDFTLRRCREALPGIAVCYHSFEKDMEMTARRMYVNPDMLPLLVVTEGERKGIFAASGYSVGMADMLLRVLRCTRDFGEDC